MRGESATAEIWRGNLTKLKRGIKKKRSVVKLKLKEFTTDFLLVKIK
jgi:hypothetical protein